MAEHLWKISWRLYCDGGVCNVVLCPCVSGIAKWPPLTILRSESSRPTNLGQHCSVLHQSHIPGASLHWMAFRGTHEKLHWRWSRETVKLLLPSKPTATLIARCKDFLNRHTKQLHISCVLKRKPVALVNKMRVATKKVKSGGTHGTNIQLQHIVRTSCRATDCVQKFRTEIVTLSEYHVCYCVYVVSWRQANGNVCVRKYGTHVNAQVKRARC